MIVDTHMHWPVGQSMDTAPMLAVMDAAGIDRGVVCGLEVLRKLDRAAHWNDLLAEFCGRSGGRLVPLATVHLAEGRAAIAEARRCVEVLGVHGFKVHPWTQGESIWLPAMSDLCNLAAEHDVPIMFHDGTPPNSLPSQIGVLAAAQPRTKLVLGHGGLLHLWEEALESVRQHPNLYITLCGQHPRAMQAICAAAVSDRIFWGTDYVGPGSEETITYRKGLADLLVLSAPQRAAVMGRSALKLYRFQN
jgi:hypothetical protein